MFLLKLLLTPLLIGLISLAGRRWGNRVSGWLVGLPLTSAPITLFLAYEQGTTFAFSVAQGILLGLISQAVFCVCYACLSFRFHWSVCWVVSWGVFFLATLAFTGISGPFPLVFLIIVALLWLILLGWPGAADQAVELKGPAWEIPGRMLLATTFVLGLTALAPLFGPHLSGLLSPLPIFATTFAVFTQRFQGSPAARQILHGVVVSSFACAVFFLCIAGLIEQFGIGAAFSAAALAALLTQGTMLQLLKRQAARLSRGDGQAVE
jgi:hypothetical protein